MGFQIVCHTNSTYGVETYDFLYKRDWSVSLLTQWQLAQKGQIAVYHVEEERLPKKDGKTPLIVPPFIYDWCIPNWAKNTLFGLGLVNNPNENDITAGYLELYLEYYKHWQETLTSELTPWKVKKNDKDFQAYQDWKIKARNSMEVVAATK